MARDPRFVLPVVERALAEARRAVDESPTVDAARTRLGGRAVPRGAIGDHVALATRFGAREIGVVVFRDDAGVDVFVGGGRVKRVGADALTPAAREDGSRELAAIADGVRVFATLDEGDRVRFEAGDGALHEGVLAEKCRYGAIVVTDAGKVMAVGFLTLWPAHASPA